jgi:hypothetical protein
LINRTVPKLELQGLKTEDVWHNMKEKNAGILGIGTGLFKKKLLLPLSFIIYHINKCFKSATIGLVRTDY